MRELLTEKFEQPTEVDSDDNMYWLNDLGQLHRDGDKPAIIWADGEGGGTKMENCIEMEISLL